MTAPEPPPPSAADEGPAPVRVGVLLPGLPARPGEWLADCTAYDAAGADVLWIDAGATPPYDVLAVAAALAAATYRVRLVVALPESVPPAAFLARALATVATLSDGRLALAADPRRRAQLHVLAPALRVFERRPAGGYDEPGAGRWAQVPSPRGRDAWGATLSGAAERGLHGLLVPPTASLLDTLRNPEPPPPRQDLRLAQG
ncbi:LLM class flavin-dependent oxidoreductase [Streptomyces sp. NPDC051940]|uniref:LLM class flavin-dependent oxidoreductase n=1 Tax=Streptomyces sp. NPDC051940 TaxID=3155675 RepID=UPI00341EC1B3